MPNTFKTSGSSLECHLQRIKRALWATEPSGNDLEHERSWSISCGLASQPRSVLSRAPQEIAHLIERARSLHPLAAAGADHQDQQTDSSDASVEPLVFPTLFDGVSAGVSAAVSAPAHEGPHQ